MKKIWQTEKNLSSRPKNKRITKALQKQQIR